VAHVLAISRYFPPLGSAGSSIRLVKLIKYASKKGWTFSIATQDVSKPVVSEHLSSDFLLAELPSDITLIRISNPIFGQSLIKRSFRRIFRTSSLPWGIWVFFNVWKFSLIKRPDLIFVNSPPFTNVAVGYLLSIVLNVPYVVDMKDDWIGSERFLEKPRFRQQIERKIEELIVKKASAVVTVTNSSLNEFIKRYPKPVLSDKLKMIPNGQDLEEFADIQQQETQNPHFRLLSTAAGYRPDYRDLSPFLEAMRIFLETNPGAEKNLEIEFAGELPDISYRNQLSKLLPDDAVLYSGNLGRSQLVDHLQQADLFFLVQPRGNKTAIAGNLYEYWATGKAPVLLLSEDGASSEIVNVNKLGMHFCFTQLGDASEYIAHIYGCFMNKKPVRISRSGVEQYDRRILADQMVTVWSSAIEQYGLLK
jgi:glycosyltransferase involved in cell wall biosynthesis